jgi:hypothetical protein
MATIHFTVTSKVVGPQQFLDALTDFSERRPTIWPNIDPGYYKVHALGPDWADVTEGSGYPNGVWERDRYDWSQKGKVRIDVLESKSFAVGSYWEYYVTSDGDNGSRIEVTLHRTGLGIKGRVVTALVGSFGGKVLRQGLEKTLTYLASQTTSPKQSVS